MTPSLQWYIILVAIGLLLLGAEIIVPGGILGTFAAFCLFAAIITGFIAFQAPYGLISAMVIMALSVICILVWIKYFPHTRMGRFLTLSSDAKTFKGTDDHLKELAEQEGVATSDLRPSGIATINDRRIDVVAEGSWIERGTKIVVLRVQGNVITVREIKNDDAS